MGPSTNGSGNGKGIRWYLQPGKYDGEKTPEEKAARYRTEKVIAGLASAREEVVTKAGTTLLLYRVNRINLRRLIKLRNRKPDKISFEVYVRPNGEAVERFWLPKHLRMTR